ncbi:MAG TPA: GNAT family N-acetyltransferase [Burkholderiaceae bacterium]|nr:GNAT family N-acetyltransferase [Burkholderiaceae bacterium]
MHTSTLPPVTATGLSLRLDDLSDPRIALLLEEHLADMRATSPPESVHALDLGRLRRPEIRFWTAWDAQGQLLGCGAIKRLSGEHAELKSMRTAVPARGRGVGRVMLARLMDDARALGVRRLSLETGSHAFFEPAHALYRSAGFKLCGPFEGYVEDPHSVFMTREL